MVRNMSGNGWKQGAAITLPGGTIIAVAKANFTGPEPEPNIVASVDDIPLTEPADGPVLVVDLCLVWPWHLRVYRPRATR